MKIDRLGTKGMTGTYKVGPAVSQQSAPVSAAGNGSDRVTLSREAQEAARLRTKLQATPEVRMDLVERIKAEVEAGTYNVEPRAVAEKLLKSGVLD